MKKNCKEGWIQIFAFSIRITMIASGYGGGGSSSNHTIDNKVLTKAKLLIEHNATDEDTDFQGVADGDPWNELTITDPDEESILTVYPEGGVFDFGLTELFFETSEPENAEVPITDVLARLVEGDYTLSGDLIETGNDSLSASFAHAISAGPVLSTPVDGSTGLVPNNVSVAGEAVTKDINGSPVNVVGYQVIVEKVIADSATPSDNYLFVAISRPVKPVHARYQINSKEWSYLILDILKVTAP